MVGASGVVGTKIIQLLETRAFPVDKFLPLGNSTVGSFIEFNNNQYQVESLDNFIPEKGQFIIFSADPALQKNMQEALLLKVL